ncbi:hypothetical protein, partial [Vibrio parahaemolyticus]|uniref:hypothetical protein n=1 Tax=Vibrio parahaemolyticus TaxID=670 RepID=UPI0024910DF0
ATPTLSASFRASALNSGEWIIRFFLLVMLHLVSDCTHLTRCPKLLVRITASNETNLLKDQNIMTFGSKEKIQATDFM